MGARPGISSDCSSAGAAACRAGVQTCGTTVRALEPPRRLLLAAAGGSSPALSTAAAARGRRPPPSRRGPLHWCLQLLSRSLTYAPLELILLALKRPGYLTLSQGDAPPRSFRLVPVQWPPAPQSPALQRPGSRAALASALPRRRSASPLPPPPAASLAELWSSRRPRMLLAGCRPGTACRVSWWRRACRA